MRKLEIAILCVGKIKLSFWQKAEEYYRQLLRNSYSFSSLEIKDVSGKMSDESRIKKEGEKIMENLPAGYGYIAMSEKGRQYTSAEMAAKIAAWEYQNRKICFIIGGPFGLSASVINRCPELFSLSPMTLPHEMARIVLMEQLFRAHCININHPYHH